MKDRTRSNGKNRHLTEEGGAPSDDGPSIYVTGKKWVKGIDQALAVGKWLVTAINEQGRRETVEIEVKPGKVTVTEVNTASWKRG